MLANIISAVKNTVVSWARALERTLKRLTRPGWQFLQSEPVRCGDSTRTNAPQYRAAQSLNSNELSLSNQPLESRSRT